MSQTIDELQHRALAVRELFAQFEKHEGSPEWGVREIIDGLVGDVGDLMKLVMAQQGLRKIDGHEAKLAHELADCLWAILVLSHKLNIDIEQAFGQTMDSLETAIKAKLNTQE